MKLKFRISRVRYNRRRIKHDFDPFQRTIPFFFFISFMTRFLRIAALTVKIFFQAFILKEKKPANCYHRYYFFFLNIFFDIFTNALARVNHVTATYVFRADVIYAVPTCSRITHVYNRKRTYIVKEEELRTFG